MLTTIKGYYDHGQVVLKEDPHIDTKTDVIVTFLSEEKKSMDSSKRSLGILKGKITVPDNFNEPSEDFEE